jgi:hypothetical protein
MYDLHMADDEKIDVDRLTDMLEAFTKGKRAIMKTVKNTCSMSSCHSSGVQGRRIRSRRR